MNLKALIALAVACFAIAGCDLFGSDPYVSSTAGLYNDPPRPFVAGREYDLRVSGDAAVDATFESATVLVFRGPVTRTGRELRGDTLAAVNVGIVPGVRSFDTTVPVQVPAGSFSEPTEGWIYVEYVETGGIGCELGCRNSTGSSVEFAPAR